MKLIGAVSDVAGRAAALAQRAAAASLRGPDAHIERVFSNSRVAIYSLRRPDESQGDLLALASPDGRDRCWFASESMLRGGEPASDQDVDGAIERLTQSIQADYLAVRVTDDDGVRLYADSWGLAWVFTRRLRDAVVFASDFEAVCAADDEPTTIDGDALLLELGIGFVPDNRTLFHEVAVVPPGATVRIAPASIDIVSEAPFEYGDVYQRASLSTKFSRLDALFETMADRMARESAGRAAISLSAGFDSRYALAWMGRKGAAGPLLTFGDPESDEVIDARNVALRHDRAPDWTLFDPTLSDFDDWRSMIQSLGNAGIVQWCGWARQWMAFVRGHSTNCAIGYLGDALSGKRFDLLAGYDTLAGELDRALDPWARRWVAFELDSGEWPQSPLLRSGARRRLVAAASERFGALLRRGRFMQPHQSAHHCNLVGRQRRWVGTQPVLLSSHVKPLSFFVDRAFREFWMNVGLEDLHGQTLYHRYAEERFPALFPKPPSAATRFTQRVMHKIRRDFGALVGHSSTRRRPPPIDRSKLLAPHYPAILALLDRMAPVLEDAIDVVGLRSGIEALARGDASSSVTSGMLFRVTNVMHLLALQEPGVSAPRPG